MALKRKEMIDFIQEERNVYIRIEEETSQVKGVCNVRCRKYILIKDKPCDISFGEFIVSGIKVDLNLPIRKQLYEFINDGSYIDILEEE